MLNARRVTAVIPYNNLEATESFYALLGFRRSPDAAEHGDYVLLGDEGGAEIHLSKAPDGWLVPGRSSYGIYFHADNVDELAAQLGDRLLHPPKHQPWGMYEFAVSDPDETLVRVGRAS